MDKLQLTGRNLGRVFNFRSGHLHSAHLWCYQLKLPNLKLKIQPKQLLGSLLLSITLPDAAKQPILSLSKPVLILAQLCNIVSNYRSMWHHENERVTYYNNAFPQIILFILFLILIQWAGKKQVMRSVIAHCLVLSCSQIGNSKLVFIRARLCHIISNYKKLSALFTMQLLSSKQNLLC
jgi:hypothetical protein